MKPFRVLHLTAGNLYGGVEAFLVTLARHRSVVPEMESHVGLCFSGRLRDDLLAANVPVHDLGETRFSRPWTVWAARRKLRETLRKLRPDVVVCHACWPHVLFGRVALKRKLPLVFWAHDALAGEHWLEGRAGKVRPTQIVANSRYTARSLPTVFPEVPTTVVYIPVPAPPNDLPDREALRASFGVTPEQCVIVMAARLEPWKGHALLIEALALLKHRGDWTVWIAGGAQRPHEITALATLQAQAFAAGIGERIRWLGQRNDIPAVLHAADLHCQPNTGPEPFGIAFVEALYAGLPVVTTDQGGPQEIVDASCGELVPPDRPDLLATALEHWIAEPARRQGVAAASRHRAGMLCDVFRQIHAIARALSPFGEGQS